MTLETLLKNAHRRCSLIDRGAVLVILSVINDTTDKAFDRYYVHRMTRSRSQIFPPGERIPAVIRHGMKADSVDAVNHGAPDIKAITETSLMWFSWRAVVSPRVSATACIDFCSVPPEWKMAPCDRSIYRLAELPLQNRHRNDGVYCKIESAKN